MIGLYMPDDSLKQPTKGDILNEAASQITPAKFKKTANSTDPIINFQLNNPIPPIKRLLKKLFANEEITIKIPVLTAIAIIAFTLGGASGFITAVKTHLAARIPIIQSILPKSTPVTTPNPWVPTSLFGTLSQLPSGDYYLILQNGDVIKLKSPQNVNLKTFLGEKVLATGTFHQQLKEMQVIEATNLVLVGSTQPVPTLSPQPTASPIPSTPTPSPSETDTPTPEPIN